MPGLSKGDSVSLSQAAPGLRAVMAAAGWEKRQQQGYGVHADFDLDLMAILLDQYGNRLPEHPNAPYSSVLFYNNRQVFPIAPGQFAMMAGKDDRDGSGAFGADDEAIGAQLDELRRHGVSQVVLSISIYDAIRRRQNFGMIANAFVRLVDMRDPNNPRELVKFPLSDFTPDATIVTFGVLNWTGTEWMFRAVGRGFYTDLETYLGKGGQQFINL